MTTPDPAAPVADADDLIERLREAAQFYVPEVPRSKLCLDAAAEIARLRAENERYQAMVLRATEAIETIGRREEALRAEVAELRRPDLRTVMGFEAGQAHVRLETDALRARVAELEALIRDLHRESGKDHYGGCSECTVTMETWERVNAVASGEPTPDPRDARIAVLEAALRDADDSRLMLAKLVHRLRQRPDLPAETHIKQAADLLARKGGSSILRERALGDDHG